MGFRPVPLILVLFALPADEDLAVVSNGTTTYEIVRAEQAPAGVRVAARELSAFLERSTGVRMTVVPAPTPGKDHLFVGANPHSTVEGLKPEGFRIKAVGRDLHIVGDDTPGDPERIRRERPTRCGTLFGVYEFLERYAGIFFAWPDDLGTIVPPRKEIRVPSSVDLVQAPDWASRTIINTPPNTTGALFGRRLRLGSSTETDYTHTWSRVLPADTLGAAHPEYFAMVRGERRAAYYDKNHGGQVCTTNPEVIDLFAKAALRKFSENPDDSVFSLSPNDGKGFCECAPCRALDPPKTGFAPDLTDRILTFYNAVAEKVARVHPTKRLGGFVYAQYQHAPTRVKPHPNVVLAHATNSAHAQGMGWAREREDERAWTSLCGSVTKYDIYYFGDYGSMNLPAPVTAHLAEKLRHEHEVGFRGGYLYAAPSWELLGAGHFLMARLMWDRGADVEALEKRYYDGLYGPAGADVLDYYRLLESRLRKARLQGIDRSEPIVARALGWTGGDETSAAFTIAAYAPILDAASALLEKARGRALSNRERERLSRLGDHHDLLTGTVRAMVAAGRLESDASFAAEEVGRFREALALREAARAKLRAYAPAFAAQLDEDDGGRLALISPTGALARLVREGAAPTGRAPARFGFDDVNESDLGAKVAGGARVAVVSGRSFAGGKSVRVTVPEGGEASFVFEAPVTPGSLVRLSLVRHCSGARPRYDHTREAPLIRLGRDLRVGVPAIEDSVDWKPFRSVLQVPPGVRRLRMTFAFPLSGDFELDEVALEELR